MILFSVIMRRAVKMHEKKEIRKRLLRTGLRTVIFVLFTWLSLTFIFGIGITESDDMYPAVRAGDVILYYRLAEPRMQDAVIYEAEGETRVGRIQACEPSLIGISDDGELTVDGRIQPVQERRGLFFDTYKVEGGVRYPLMISHGEYFILGDKRDTSFDSRRCGAVRRKSIKGKIFMILRRRAI